MSASDEPRDGNGHSNGASNGRNPFTARTDYQPDDFVTTKVRYRNRQRFNGWFRSQYPDLDQLPKRDDWCDRVFELGLDRIEKLMPPQLSAEDRLAAAIEGQQ